MTTTQKLLAVAALVLLLWWWSKRTAIVVAPGQHPSTPITPVTPVQGPPSSPDAGGYVTTYPPAPDVSKGVSPGEQDVFEDNGSNSGSGAWQAALYRQLWAPAARVKLSDISPAEWKDVIAFFSGGWDRRDDLGLLAQVIMAQASSQSGAIIFEQIFSAIEGLIPIVGGILSKADNSTVQTLNDQQAWDSAMSGGALGMSLASGLLNGDSRTSAVLANYNDDGVTFDLAGNASDGPEGTLTYQLLNKNGAQQPPLFQLQNFKPEQPVLTSADGHKFRVRLRLFTKFPGGWLFPWLSVPFCGQQGSPPVDHRTGTTGLLATVNIRARFFRALDAIICQHSPYTRERPPHGYHADVFFGKDLPFDPRLSPREMGPNAVADKTVYFYTNPLLGPMLGSIFPPSLEDSRYIGNDGRTYSYYGEPMDHPNPGVWSDKLKAGVGGEGVDELATGYHDDHDVDPKWLLANGPATAKLPGTATQPAGTTAPSGGVGVPLPPPITPTVVVPVVALGPSVPSVPPLLGGLPAGTLGAACRLDVDCSGNLRCNAGVCANPTIRQQRGA